MKKLLCVALMLAGCAQTAADQSEDDLSKKISISFTASPTSIDAGQSTQLTWTVKNATAARIDNGVGVVALSGHAALSPSASTTYTLTATAGKTATKSATLTVTVKPRTTGSGLVYSDPATGQVKLVRDPSSTSTHLVLKLVVGDQALSGFGVALNLPASATQVSMGSGVTANPAIIDPGGVMLTGKQFTTGPLAGALTVGVARKKQTASDGDLTLPAGATLLSFALDLLPQAPAGVVFDGAAGGKVLRGAVIGAGGQEVVGTAGFGVGKLAVQ